MDNIIPMRAAFDGYTNHDGLYIKGGNYSVTDLLDSPRVIQLRNRYGDRLPPESVASLLKSFQGNAWHGALEKGLRRAAGLEPYRNRFLVEAKFWERVADRKIVGKLDCYDSGTKTLYDFKVTSIYKAMFGDFSDWETQLNVYAWFLESNDFEVKRIVIVCIHTEWNKYDAMRDPKYPKDPVHEIVLKLWTFEERERLVRERIEALKASENLPDGELPPCTSEDMWEKPTKFAVMLPGAKKASRVVDSEEEAHQWVVWNNSESGRKKIDNYNIEKRGAERTRCENYCRVNVYCNQYIDYTLEKDGAMA